MSWNPFDKYRKEQRAQRQEFAECDRQRAEAQMKQRAFSRYTAAGGRREDFEAAWPELQRELLKDAAVNSVRKVN